MKKSRGDDYMQKIVFFDIDGTLVTPKNKLPNSTKSAIYQLIKNGHIPVLSTGRPPKMLKAVAEELGIDSYISLNSQYIVVKGKELQANTLSTKAIEKLIDKSYSLDHRTFLLTKDKVIGNVFMDEMISDSDFLTFVYSNLSELPESVTAELFKRMTEKPLERYRYEEEEILSAFIHTDEKYDDIYKEDFPIFHFTRATPFLSEVLVKGSHKAVGMEQVANAFGKTLEETIAFGDSLNDIEMIQAAGIGVAMGNGREEIKKSADYITTHVENDGIYNGLKHLELI